LREPELQGYDLSPESYLMQNTEAFSQPPWSGDLRACSIMWDWSRGFGRQQ